MCCLRQWRMRIRGEQQPSVGSLHGGGEGLHPETVRIYTHQKETNKVFVFMFLFFSLKNKEDVCVGGVCVCVCARTPFCGGGGREEAGFHTEGTTAAKRTCASSPLSLMQYILPSEEAYNCLHMFRSWCVP